MKHPVQRGDFTADPRLWVLSAIAIFIGAISTLVALFLLAMIRFFTNLFFFQELSIAERLPSAHHLGAWVVLIPAAGGIAIGLMARYGSERIRGHGIPEALEAILFGKSVMSLKVAVLKPISSAVSIGSGGPFGAEGPIIMTGGAVGSLIGQAFHLTASERKTLLVAGAAAGMSAIFATPIAAVLLAVELLLFEWKPRSLIPVAIAAAVAAAFRPLLLGSGPLFPSSAHAPLGLVALGVTAVLGLVAGAFSMGLSTSLYWLEDLFPKLRVHWMWWPAIGGLVVGLGGYFQPRALGVGYDVIAEYLRGEYLLGPSLALIAVKATIWIVALASGTSGGVLAPLLMMGCALGSLISPFQPEVSAGLWPLLGMAAVLGGMMRSCRS